MRVLMGGSEEDLTESLEEAMEKYPEACAVLVRRHGMLVSAGLGGGERDC